jgi:hypothetical protein
VWAWGVLVALHVNPVPTSASHSWTICAHLIVKGDVTPLMYAARYDSRAIAKLLLDAKAGVNAKDTVSGCEALGRVCLYRVRRLWRGYRSERLEGAAERLPFRRVKGCRSLTVRGCGYRG